MSLLNHNVYWSYEGYGADRRDKEINDYVRDIVASLLESGLNLLKLKYGHKGL